MAHDVGSPLAGIVYALASLVFSVAGLSLLHGTRPSQTGSAHVATLFGFTYRVVGVFGALLLFIGLTLSAVPWLLGVWADDEGRAAAIVLCLLAPILWFVERILPDKRRLDLKLKQRRFHGCGCAVVWFGSTLIEWAAARPHDPVVKGLGMQIAGCDGGYRSPFLIYASGWLTSLIFGTIFLCLVGVHGLRGGEESDSDEATTGGVSRQKRSDQAIRCKALPIIYGFATSMACLAFALGVSLDSMQWIAFGALLLAIGVLCAWQWFWYLELTLSHWAVASQAIATWLRNAQAHLFFRDFRWLPVSDEGDETGRLLALEKYPGVWIYLLGFFLTSAVCACVMAAPPVHAHREPDAAGSQPLAGGKTKKPVNRSPIVRFVVGLEWVVFAIMVTFYYLGITRPLMETSFELPGLHYVHSGPQMAQEVAAASNGPVQKDMHMHPGGSYLRLITTLYDDRLPCSAMVISFNTCVRAPMQILTFLAVMLRPSFMSNGMLRNLQAIWIEHQAPGWFCNPMVIMLLVALLNLTGPSGSMYNSTLGRGFWLFLVYATTSVFNAWLFMAFPESGAFASLVEAAKKRSLDMRNSISPLKEENSTHMDSSFPEPSKPGYEAMEDAEAGTDGSESSEGESDHLITITTVKKGAAALGICVILVMLAVSTYLGLTRPFLDFEYRLSGVAMQQATPTVLELLNGIGDIQRYLQVFAALTLFGSLAAWVPLFIVRLALHTADGSKNMVSEVARILEVAVRPWVMIDIWAFSVLLIYYIVTARNKGIVEVCAALPKFPIGLTSIFVTLVAAKGLKHLAREVMPSGMTGVHHHHGAGRGASLPGGNGIWGAAYGLTLMSTASYFYVHGPVATPNIQNLWDLNREVEVMVPLVNTRMREKLPHSVGNCQALWEHEVKKGADASSYDNFMTGCRGQKALAQVHDQRLFGEATWATGIDSLEIMQLQVRPPINITHDTRRWNMTVSGRFTDLHLWLRVNMGDRELINDYMCCRNPFHFAIEASVTCTDGKGFGVVELEVAQIDRIEFEHQTEIASDPLDETSLQVNYGSFKEVEGSVRDFLTMKTGHLLLKNPDGSVTDPLDSAGSYLQKIVELNTGHLCLRHADAMGNGPPVSELWQEPFAFS